MKLNLFLFIGLLITASSTRAQTTVTYTESTAIFANPERGLQKYSITNSSYNTTTGYTNLSQSTLEGWRTGDDKVTVIFRYFLLDNFMSSNISTTYLNNIQNDFNVIRNAGLKCIVRFSYSNTQSSSAQQPVKSRILTHINQLAPLLEANKDIIYSHQAGFLGTWGEWYYTNSTEFGTAGTVNTTQWANRKEIVDAMLAATPVNVPVQVRYPKIKQTMYGSTQLASSTAYQNTARARIGFYNDAFLNVWGDQGTYSGVGQYDSPVGSTDYIYLANETKYTPMTGETNAVNAPRTNGANAVTEMNATNWSTLNRDYLAQNITNWINSGHYPEIQRRLGYRFVLKNGTYSLSGTSLSLSIVIQNIGFARLVKPRSAVLVLRNSSNGNQHSFTLNTDPRTWEGQFTLSQTVNISSIPNGDYTVHLRLADPNSALATRSDYSIRFGNNNVWDSYHGYNNLNYSFTKSSSGSDCPSINVNIDGNVNEWSSISAYAQVNGETFKVYDDASYVYFMFSGNSFANYQIYIDSNNGASGYTAHNWSGLAADYRIENGGLRQYTGTGTNWSWNNLGSLTAAVNNGKVEVRMPRSYFSGSSFKAGFRTLNSSWQVVSFLPAQQGITQYNICTQTLKSQTLSGESSDDIGQTELLVYPNPVKDVINIRNGYSVEEISLFSVDGVLLRNVLPNDCLTGACQINVSDLPGGIYFLIMKTTQETKTIKIIKN